MKTFPDLFHLCTPSPVLRPEEDTEGRTEDHLVPLAKPLPSSGLFPQSLSYFPKGGSKADTSVGKMTASWQKWANTRTCVKEKR